MPKTPIYIGPAPWAHDDTEGRARARPRIAIGIVLSLLLHAMLYFLMPKPVQVDGAPTSGPLEVRLAPPAAPPARVAKAEPPRIPPPRRTLTAPRSNRPAPFVVPEEPPDKTPPPMPPPPPDQPQSMAELVERNRARRAAEDVAAARYNADGRAAAGDQTTEERRAASLAGNLQSLSKKDGTNGIFQMTYKGHRYAQFSFREWTTDAGSSKRRLIDVDAGQGGDVEIAVVRKMIELIREHYKGDFNWESQRLGRVIPMSARLADNDQLERFLMKEFDFGSVR